MTTAALAPRPGLGVYVGASVALHLAVAVFVIILAWQGRSKPAPEPILFELVGVTDPPARGPRMPTPPASAPAEPVPTPAAVPPQPMAVKPTSTPTTVKPPPTSTPAPANTAHTPATATASGDPTGDTLSVSTSAAGGKGIPSVMSLWLSRVRFMVSQNFQAPPGLTNIAASPELSFAIERDGKPTRPVLRVRSGNPTLDRAALRAVQAVDVFPPVPNAWPADQVAIRYVLDYAP